MSSYSDYYKDQDQQEFIERWAPEDKVPPVATRETLRWNIARANAAEAKVAEYRAALRHLRSFLDDA